jgi:hypothetical protein
MARIARVPQEPGRPACLLEEKAGEKGRRDQPPGPEETTFGSEKRSIAKVPRNEGNEVKREGHVGIGSAHSTYDNGELAPEDPEEGRS